MSEMNDSEVLNRRAREEKREGRFQKSASPEVEYSLDLGIEHGRESCGNQVEG